MSRSRANTLTPAPLPPRVSLVDRLKNHAWHAPDTSLPGPPGVHLDSQYPFQVSCCEVCGSICSPLMMYYRDTTTILYRVQQHCRKLVPSMIGQQTRALEGARTAQRGILDVSDSLAMIETLNGPVQKSFADIVSRTKNSAALLRELQRSAQEEERAKEQQRLARLNASNSLPTTPKNERESSSLESIERAQPRGKRHQNTRTNTATNSAVQTPSRGRGQSTPVASASTFTSPLRVRPESVSSGTSNQNTTTPTSLRGRLSGVFSPSSSSSTATHPSSRFVAAPEIVKEEAEELQPHAADVHLDVPPELIVPPKQSERDPTDALDQSISAFVP